MKRRMKKILSLLLSLCLGWSILSLAPVTASAEDTVIEKVLATYQPGPVVLMPVSTPVIATSTAGCTIGSAVWYDQDGTPASGSFENVEYRLEIRIDAGEGYVFAENVRAYMNNSNNGVEVTRDESGKSVTLVRKVTPALWAPSVVKHPGGETVTENGWASFVATAIYAESCTWSLVSPDGSKVVDCADIGASFPGSSVKDDGVGKIILNNIPLEMDGWQIRATFTGPGGSKTSNGAYIYVKADPEKLSTTPEPTPTPAPTPPPTPPTAGPDAPAEGGGAEEHEHQFGEAWQTSAEYHWHECQCGEQSDKAQHSFQWTVVRTATKKVAGEEKGVCSVCGYETTRALAYDAASEDIVAGVPIGLVIGILVLLIVVLVIVDMVRSTRRSRRR